MTTFINLTRELLKSEVFSHLPDEEIARLHWMILRAQQDEELPLQPLLTFWYRGNYYSSNASPGLLQSCNEYLQRMGQPLIDVYGEEFYEA
ncbi:MAG TPA: hypothetical protein VKU83_04480 [Puia sp.]|nr:hypothetical protein [Puia sp.]